jgi:UDP-glucose 4-epimerase
MQKKSYLHVSELVDGMLYVASMPKRHNKVEVVNIGCSDAGILVKDIANIVRNLVAPSATIRYGTSDRGWLGDVPRFSYNTEYLEKLGWQPKMSSHSAVLLAANEISIRLNPNEN